MSLNRVVILMCPKNYLIVRWNLTGVAISRVQYSTFPHHYLVIFKLQSLLNVWNIMWNYIAKHDSKQFLILSGSHRDLRFYILQNNRPISPNRHQLSGTRFPMNKMMTYLYIMSCCVCDSCWKHHLLWNHRKER